MDELKWSFYDQMFLIRQVEEKLLTLFSKGLLPGTIHTSIGQEAVAVGVVNALDSALDVVWSNHRSHGHFLAFTDDLRGLVAEIMGKAEGVCGGIGGSQHLHARNFYSNGVLGGTIACAVGTALAEKRKRSGAIVAAFMGDGALGEGIVYESFNIASLWNLPILFVLEDNLYAQSTPKALEHAGNLYQRAESFGIETRVLTGVYDPLSIHRVAEECIHLVRTESRPVFLCVETYRLAPHSKGDDFRSDEELECYREKDALKLLRANLQSEDGARLAEIEGKIFDRVEFIVEEVSALSALPVDSFLGGKVQ